MTIMALASFDPPEGYARAPPWERDPYYLRMNMIWIAKGLVPVFSTESDSYVSRVGESFSLAEYRTDDHSGFALDEADLKAWARADEESDEAVFGMLYGYPKCCVEEYTTTEPFRYWTELANALEDGEQVRGFVLEHRPCRTCLFEGGESEVLDMQLREALPTGSSLQTYFDGIKEAAERYISVPPSEDRDRFIFDQKDPRYMSPSEGQAIKTAVYYSSSLRVPTFSALGGTTSSRPAFLE